MDPAVSDLQLPGLSDPYELPQSALDEFAEKGFVRVDGLLAEDEVAAYAPVVEEVAPKARFDHRPLDARDTFGRAFLQLGHLRFIDLRMQALLSSVRFARVAGELLGVDAVRAYHDQALFKEPGGGATPWHQGQFYWPFDTPDAVTMWMPMHDITEDMGVLRLAVGSHRFGSLGDFHISDESHAAFGRMVEDLNLEVLPPSSYKAGDAVFFRGWTFASEGENRSEEMRRVMTMVYYADGARVARLDHPVRLLARDTFFPKAEVGDFAASNGTPVLWRRPVG